MINYNEINDFIIKVFNYYNGKINIVNKAVLDINWCNLINCGAGGYSRIPNIVVINPMVINRFYGDSEFNTKIAIIETIIHELYHTDQLINYNKYISDVNYNKYIEHACEVQTAIYIAGHIQEIYNVFGLYGTISRAYDKCMMYWDLPGIYYQRRYYHDHIFMCIDSMCDLEPEVSSIIYNLITDNIKEKNNIIININKDTIPVCVNGELIDIDDFNRIMAKYVCTGVYKIKQEISYYKKPIKELIINMEAKVLNLMCKKV